MANPVQKTNILVYDLRAYHDGTLPLTKQEFHQPTVEILRCSHWLVSVWNHSNLSAPYWRLYWNEDKGAVVRLDDTDYFLEPDYLVLIAPNTPFRTFMEKSSGGQEEENVMVGCPFDDSIFEKLTVNSSNNMIRHFFIHFTAGAPYDGIGSNIFRFELGGRLLETLHELTQSMHASPGCFDHRQSLAQMALVNYALARIPESKWPAVQTDRRILKVTEYIDNHFADCLTNKQLARLVGMTANAFVRLFKDKTGQTPLHYLRIRRVEKASILLHHTDETIEEVAESCGFCNRYYFSKIFRETHGVGPATYRKTRLS